MPEGADTPLASTPLLEAVLSVGTDLELHATLQHIVDGAARLTGAGYGTLGATGTGGGTPAELFVAGGAARARPAGDAPGGDVIRVPVHVHGEPFGDLLLADKAGGPFTEEDRQLLKILASQAGIAIGNARLFEAARRRERWIEGAAAVTTALLTGSEAADALMTVADRARILADAAAGVILQPTEAGGMRIVAASTDGAPHGWGASARERPEAQAAPGPSRSPHHDDGHNDLIGTTIEPGSAVLTQLLGGEPVFIDDSATDPRMTTHVRVRFGPSMMLPLQAGGRLIGTLALPRRRGAPAYTAAERLLATQFASQAALALVLADAQQSRQRLAVFEDRDRIARDLHDLVVQRLFATGMMLESTRHRARSTPVESTLDHAVDELESTIQEVRTAIFALQQPPADAPTTFRGKVLRETAGAAAVLGLQPSVRFDGAVDVGGLRGVQTADKLRLSVVSGFEVACLDALGKTLGLPVHALLGGKVRDAVEYSAYLFYKHAQHPAGVPHEPDDGWGAALDPAGIVAQARLFTERYGFTSFKLKGGVFPPEEEIAAVRALAEAFPGAPLRLDPNGAWSVETSLKVAAELEDVLEYLEDPALGTPAMAEVAARTPVPLATNMCVTTFEEIPEAFGKENGGRSAVRVVLSDHHYWGGLRRTRELAAVCRTFGVDVSMHSNTHLGISLAAMTHVAATVPGLRHACDSHYPWQSEDVLSERPRFVDGAIAVTDTPGLGVELDREKLAALHARWLDDGFRAMRERDDAAAMRVTDPGWRTPAVPRW